MAAKRETRATNRPTRKRVGAGDALKSPKIEGYVTRWVNNSEGRIQEFKDAGWEIVTGNDKLSDRAGTDTPVTSVLEKSAGTSKDGLPMKTVCMKQRIEFYEEDQADKERDRKTQENQMRRSKTKPNQAGPDGNYGTVTISHPS